ncbi:DUF1036 domain-containing protein [Devosia sp.]|uniref:DUF1036 domain-containing protein n=1 Tax=Devosia sp. TaxID=1871048 RepID=UPI003BAD3446
MRYILATTGVIVAALIAVVIWMVLPHAGGNQAAIAQDQPAAAAPATPAPAPTAGDDGSLRVCNQTGNQVSIALGYKAAKGWQSEGWWVAKPGECKSVYNGKLDARYYYIFAADDIGGGVWDGTNFMCTRDETFTIFGVEDCLARGYERTGFFEVDTQSKNNWTLQLTEGEVISGGDNNQDEAVPLEGDLPSDGTVNPQDQPNPDDGVTDGTDSGADPGATDTPTDEGAVIQ